LDTGILESALRLLAARTGLVALRAGRFYVTSRYNPEARFALHQYLGAYGQNATQLGALLHDSSQAQNLIDRRRHAAAFAQVDVMGPNIVADVVSQLELNHLLDLGCGVGTMLVNLAIRNPEFVGWGVDANPWMYAAARKRLRSARVASRVKVFKGDCRRVQCVLPARVCKSVRTICAASVANEFFAGGDTLAVEWLAGLKASFAERILLIADYYSGAEKAAGQSSRKMTLHNFIQTISGQGSPPANLKLWKGIYRSAGCQLLHVIELSDSPFFVHMLRL
jgi:hypothetical protein